MLFTIAILDIQLNYITMCNSLGYKACKNFQWSVTPFQNPEGELFVRILKGCPLSRSVA